MYQVNFSDQAMRELAKLPTLEQMEVVEAFTSLTAEELLRGSSELGTVRRSGHTYHRLRVGEFRIYFEASEGSLLAHYGFISTPTPTSRSVHTCPSRKTKHGSNKKAASGNTSTNPRSPDREHPSRKTPVCFA